MNNYYAVTATSVSDQKRRHGEEHKSESSKRSKPDKSVRFDKFKKKRNLGARTERVNAVTKGKTAEFYCFFSQSVRIL